jgi:uncharacterized membrane protein YqgA involved in biofilm formation
LYATLVNVATVIIGNTIGLIIYSILPEKISNTALQSVGLFTIILGIIMTIKTSNFLIMIFIIIIGSVIGETINIDKKI